MGILRKILIGLGIVILCFGVYVVYLAMTTKSHSPAATASFSTDEVDIQVHYSRPFMKDRLIFGTKNESALVPYGEKWRTGANEATQITINKDVWVEGEPLKAGTYSIYSIPERDHWIVAFNSRVGYWGAGFTKDPFDEAHDVLRVKASVAQLSEPVDQFGISLQRGTDESVVLSFAWDKTQSSVKITF